MAARSISNPKVQVRLLYNALIRKNGKQADEIDASIIIGEVVGQTMKIGAARNNLLCK